MRKIIYVCDRCSAEIKGRAKYIAINDLDDDGLIIDSKNPLDGCEFCSKCVGEVLAFISNKETKRRGRPPKRDIYSKNAKAMLAKGE